MRRGQHRHDAGEAAGGAWQGCAIGCVGQESEDPVGLTVLIPGPLSMNPDFWTAAAASV